MGFISDNTKSRWGRRGNMSFWRIVMGIAFVTMWQLYRGNGVDYNFTYFLIWSFAFYIGLTIFSVPYVAIGYEMSTDFHERTRNHGYRPVDRSVGMGYCSMVLGDHVRSGMVSNSRGCYTRACRIWVGSCLLDAVPWYLACSSLVDPLERGLCAADLQDYRK
jgi:Na+/melibiose symporter-like transporter